MAFPQWREGLLPEDGFAGRFTWEVVETVRRAAPLGPDSSTARVMHRRGLPDAGTAASAAVGRRVQDLDFQWQGDVEDDGGEEHEGTVLEPVGVAGNVVGFVPADALADDTDGSKAAALQVRPPRTRG